MKNNSIAIVGGGASGLVAAIYAARSGGNVTVLESSSRVGRKILATGNGRCNMTNINAGVQHYHGNKPKFVLGAVNRFWVDETLAFFKELGILTKTEEGGKVYPYSDQASAVLDVLRFAAEESGVRIVTDFEVESVLKTDRGFKITSYDGQTAAADKVIIATGGKAAPDLGSKGTGYEILKSFGHKITDLKPSLVQIKTETEVVKKIKGIKLMANAVLGKRSEYGEVLFTEYGLSGPAVFSLSPYICGQDVISLDIMPEYTNEQIYEMIFERIANRPKITLENFFVGMLNRRVGQALLKFAGAEPLSRYAVTLNEKEVLRICDTIKRWNFKIAGTMSWNNAQTTRGGALTDEFNPNTMQSKLVNGLYAVGEVLDIDGDCGGFNLQWAWSSGAMAGMAAADINE